ncbi:hypothetical protein [Bacillus weihaiensis]|uniref:hypothetical protein n=1 Tax=Bacillus weihaiensis TaxID=1547283 RepID=UPI001314DA6D|nr:hypothetical protein [Bacillus weihaiensis]
MSNEELLNNNMLRARIMNVEYEILSEKEIISEIKRVYYEENGIQLTTDQMGF